MSRQIKQRFQRLEEEIGGRERAVTTREQLVTERERSVEEREKLLTQGKGQAFFKLLVQWFAASHSHTNTHTHIVQSLMPNLTLDRRTEPERNVSELLSYL